MSQIVDKKNITVDFVEGDENRKDHINIEIDFKKRIAFEKGIFENDDDIKEYIQDIIVEINEAIDLYCDEIHEELNEDIDEDNND